MSGTTPRSSSAAEDLAAPSRRCRSSARRPAARASSASRRARVEVGRDEVEVARARRGARGGAASTSTTRQTPSSIVTASGCAPPMPPQPAVSTSAAAQAAVEALARDRRERLERALQDALRADVDPRPRRHLAVHRQPLGLEPPERLPVGPVGHEQAVGDQHARGAISWVRKTPTGLPLCTSSVSSFSSRRSVATIAWNASHERAARPVPP